MNEFLTKEDQRKNRILEAALIEFADKGYKRASTNTIVKQANVSKGLLFHYYISKKDLYILIFKSAIETITEDLYNNVDFTENDVLNRLYQSTVAKIESYTSHPLFVKFLENHSSIAEEDIIKETSKIEAKYASETFEKIFSNIDYYLFREAINVERSLDVVKWTIDRISTDWKKSNNNQITPETLEELTMDISHYLDLFREAFYR
ncbi:MAG: TetR/AcrR family transcriptional regulator [Bacilli bacterium]|nr:TetR/AcrR family transcriptional regulator [Bacilli bacterium]